MLRDGLTFDIQQFSCKDELVSRLPKRLKGYASWLPDARRLFVLVDRDDDDCRLLKARLEKIAMDAGLKTWTKHGHARFQVCNRIVVEELESWFFGDWQAVRAAYPRVDATLPSRAGFRNPDAIAGGTWEALERELKKRGYHAAGLPKITFAREVAAHMVPARNKSASFKMLRDTLAIL